MARSGPSGGRFAATWVDLRLSVALYRRTARAPARGCTGRIPVLHGWSLQVLERKQLKGCTQITFVLPQDTPEGPVSVVGDFNHWNPAAHPLEPRGDGARAASVTLPAHSAHSFRYLAAGDYWFDEEDADGHDGTNSRLHT